MNAPLLGVWVGVKYTEVDELDGVDVGGDSGKLGPGLVKTDENAMLVVAMVLGRCRRCARRCDRCRGAKPKLPSPDAPFIGFDAINVTRLTNRGNLLSA
jgi:hypothetical protein